MALEPTQSPHLLPELIQEIVEICAEGSLSQAAALATISRDFNKCVRPILSRTLMCNYSSPSLQWPVPVKNLPRWLETNGKYVRNVIWGINVNDGVLQSIFERCPGITNLAIWVNTSSNDISNLLPAISTLRLYRLSISLSDLFSQHNFSEPEASSGAFRSITHLDIIFDGTKWEEFEGITHLPCLTHLSLPQQTFTPTYTKMINSILRECPRLKVLVLVAGRGFSSDAPVQASQVPCDYETHDGGNDEDPRLVAFDCDYVADWVYGATGRKDIWALADEIVARRLEDRKNLDYLQS
ncbi:hypothetical protein BDN72DRAFT_962652 [Pluteus cervinus]|uniref:Uncharacterized protein n=1 Tax=Pluteus cervinus TaxID=181527 RepID=A0ACD3AIA6_9AGAR|nr:hypothetical protein BDN72DRAFT_962652 [Pluteus cervinus]